MPYVIWVCPMKAENEEWHLGRAELATGSKILFSTRRRGPWFFEYFHFFSSSSGGGALTWSFIHWNGCT
jgi:hypothetical protein